MASTAAEASMNVAARAAGARFDRRQRATGLGGVAMLAGLALAITPQAPVPLAVAVTGAGVLAAAAMLTPPALQAVYRHRGLGLVIVLVGLGALWVVSGVRHANGATSAFGGQNPPSGIPYPFVFGSYGRMVGPLLSSAWPWRTGPGTCCGRSGRRCWPLHRWISASTPPCWRSRPACRC